MTTQTQSVLEVPAIFTWNLDNVTLEDILEIYVSVLGRYQTKPKPKPRNQVKPNPLANVDTFPVSVPRATPEMLHRLTVFAAA